MSVFKKLESVLRADEALNFQIRREGAAWTVLIQPVLNGSDDDLPEAAKPIRASLSVPLILRGGSEQIDQQFDELLSTYGEQRARTGDAFNAALDSLREAEKAAKATSSKTGRGAVKKPAPAAAAATEDADDDDAEAETPAASSAPPSVVAPASNPDSLF